MKRRLALAFSTHGGVSIRGRTVQGNIAVYRQ